MRLKGAELNKLLQEYGAKSGVDDEAYFRLDPIEGKIIPEDEWIRKYIIVKNVKEEEETAR